jgi:type IV fimbrial biogenesis protein FimT
MQPNVFAAARLLRAAAAQQQGWSDMSSDGEVKPGCRSVARRPAAGFTLIELLTTLVVAAVLLAFIVPGLANFVSSSRLRASQSEFVSALTLARSEATKRGTQVAVSATAPVTGAEFNGGWRVFADANANGALDSGELVIREYPPLAGQVTFSTVGGATLASFNSRGFLSPATTIDFKLCGPTGIKKGFSIKLEPVGLADVVEGDSCT